MMRITAPQPQPTGLMAHVANLLGDDEIPRIELAPRAQEEEKKTQSEFRSALKQVLETLENTKKENLLENREIVFFLSDGIPLLSVESVSILLKHIHQITVEKEASIDQSEFTSSLDRVLEGLNHMKKDSSPLPTELASLFGKEHSPSLLETLKALLAHAKADEKLQDEEVDEGFTTKELGLKLQQSPLGKVERARSDCATTVDLTEVGSDITNLGCLSSKASEATFDGIGERNVFSNKDLQDVIAKRNMADSDPISSFPETTCVTPDIDSCLLPRDYDEIVQVANVTTQSNGQCEVEAIADFRKEIAQCEDLLIPQLSMDAQESKAMSEINLHLSESAAKSKQTEECTDTLKESNIKYYPQSLTKREGVNSTGHYKDAVHKIKVIKINLRMEEESEYDSDIDSHARAWSKTVDNSKLYSIELPTVTSKPPTQSDAPPGAACSVASDCDSTVDCSLDSVVIADDEESETSEETEGTGFFNCAFDSMLDAVLGPCSLRDDESDSSLSSSGSERSHNTEGVARDCYSANAQVDNMTIENTQAHRIPPTVVVANCDEASNPEQAKSWNQTSKTLTWDPTLKMGTGGYMM